jgi:CD109 antigen
MAVMEVTLPSGFTVDADTLPSLRMSQNVKRVETKNGDTVVVLYFDKVCPVQCSVVCGVQSSSPLSTIFYDFRRELPTSKWIFQFFNSNVLKHESPRRLQT